jgi:hypothetical protein
MRYFKTATYPAFCAEHVPCYENAKPLVKAMMAAGFEFKSYHWDPDCQPPHERISVVLFRSEWKDGKPVNRPVYEKFWDDTPRFTEGMLTKALREALVLVAKDAVEEIKERVAKL